MTPLTLAMLAGSALSDAPTGAPVTPPVEVVVVSASPLADKSDALSQGVAVVSRLEAANASLSGGIGEALSGVAGVRATFYGPNASRPIIRGLGEDRIRLMLNGLTGIDASTISPDHAPAIDGLDAERIEVLKGPAALRFGSNAIGGVVNVVDGRLPDRLPARPIEGEVFVGATSAESAQAGAMRLSATKGDLVVRIDGLARLSDDYDIPGFVQTTRLRAQTGDDSRGSVFNTRGEIWAIGASVARITGRKTESEYGIPSEEAFIALEQTRFDAKASIKDVGIFDNITFSATTGDYTHSEIEFDGAIGTVFTNQGYEARLEGRLKSVGNFEGLYGVQLGSNDFAAAGEEAFILPVTIKQRGFFGFHRYDGGGWGGEFGARFEQREYDGLAGQRDFDLSSFSASIFTTPFDGVRLSLMAARTERAPTEVELFADGPHAATSAFEIGSASLNKEIATSIEGGLSWRQNGVKVQFDVWRAQFDGFVGFAPTGAIKDDLPVFEVTQADAMLSGFEFTFTAPLYSGTQWRVNGDIGFDYVVGEYTNAGNIARMPPSLTTLGLEAKSKVWTLRGEVEVLGEQDKVAAFETPTNGATTYNLHIGFRPLKDNENLELSLEGRNLSDEEVREHTSFLKDKLPKPGRSIRLSWRARF
jgi:iron complex outermembrane recepter protein